MKERSAKLFFLEFVFVLFSFAICAVVCVRIFTNAHLTSQRSKETSCAIVTAQSAAEAFKAGDWQSLGCREKGPEGMLALYYDPNWNLASTFDRRMLKMSLSSNGMLQSAQITVYLDNSALFSLTVCRTLGGTAP